MIDRVGVGCRVCFLYICGFVLFYGGGGVDFVGSGG